MQVAALAERMDVAVHHSMPSSRAPGTASRWWFTRWKCSPMMCRPRIAASDGGRRRPGRRPSSRSGSWRGARPVATAAKASSKVAQGSGSIVREDLPAGQVGIGAGQPWKAMRGIARLSARFRACLRRPLAPSPRRSVCRHYRRPGRRQRGHAKRARARSRSAGVSTPSGTVSTRATSMRMPASSARSCSSRSRRSSGLGGRATKRSSAARR